MPEMESVLGEKSCDFIREITGKNLQLHKSLGNFFKRITLVHKSRPERFTIDVNLGFDQDQNEIELSQMVIAELKQSSQSRETESFQSLRKLGIRPMGMSKYCLGMMLTRPGLKHNNFKRKRIFVEKL